MLFRICSGWGGRVVNIVIVTIQYIDSNIHGGCYIIIFSNREMLKSKSIYNLNTVLLVY